MIDLQSLPAEPGCYLFSDDEGSIIYVGKAKNLRRRVSSYFSRHDLDPKTRILVAAIATVDFIVTDTEVEAFILENTLIKKHQPKYNIDLKDSKSYAYIHITDEPYPRFHVARGPDGNGRYYGPFVSARERDDLLPPAEEDVRAPVLQAAPPAPLPQGSHRFVQRPLHERDR